MERFSKISSSILGTTGVQASDNTYGSGSALTLSSAIPLVERL